MSKKVLMVGIFILSLCFVATSYAASSSQITGSGTVIKKTMAKKSYAGAYARNYEVYVPQGLVAGQKYPMIMALHGCKMEDSATGYPQSDALREWNLDIIADNNKVILVFPYLAPAPAGYPYTDGRAANCWGWWIDAHLHAGAGEPEDIYQIAKEVEAAIGEIYSGKIDPNRRYITGISAGSAMAIIEAVVYSKYWAAIAVAEAMPYGEVAGCTTFGDTAPTGCTPTATLEAKTRTELEKTKTNGVIDYRMVPIMEIHSLNDHVADFTPNAANVRNVWLRIFGSGDSHPATTLLDCMYEGISCEQKRYVNSSNKVIIETRYFNGDYGTGVQTAKLGTGHYWVGDDGSDDNWSYAKGPVNSTAVWAFLQDKCLDDNCGNQPPTAPTNLTASNTTCSGTTLSWTASTDPDGSVAGYDIMERTAGKKGETATTSYAVTGLSQGTHYYFTVKAFDNLNKRGLPSNEVDVLTSSTNCPNTPPTVPTGLTASNIGQTSFTLSWTASTDNVGVAGYEVFQSPSPEATYVSKGTVTGTSKAISGLTAGTSYYFKVSAYDGATPPLYSEKSAKLPVPTLPSFTPVQYSSSNYAHVTSSPSRATTSGGYTYTRGSGENLGLYIMYPTDVKVCQTAPGYYKKGLCP